MDDQNMHIDDNPVRFPEDQSPEDIPATGDAPAMIGDPDRPDGELGFSLSELLIAIAIIGILSVVVIGELQSAIEKAKLSACLANMVTIRDVVWANCDGGMDFPGRELRWGCL